MDEEFSHPGVVLHEIMAPVESVYTEFVGWDYDPRTNTYEAAFRYDYWLPEADYFHQAAGQNIYWLSIGAGYCGMEPGENPWGWKTRPRADDSPAPDAAVIMPNPGHVYTPPGTTWEQIGGGAPILWPDESGEWDMAFMLDSRAYLASSKWIQPPDPEWPGLHAVQGPDEGVILADNWECEGGDVREFRWYGNYEVDIDGNEKRGAGISYFHLSIHTNVPNDPWCLPRDPEVVGYDVPFVATFEEDTGMVNSEGSPIYRYRYVLPEGFPQQETNIYWLDLTAYPNDYADVPSWRCQEAQRSYPPILCPAARRYTAPPTPWQSIGWANMTWSDLAFEVYSGFYGEMDVKWSQPPVTYTPSDAFYGWDEYSVYGEDIPETQIVADDWYCATTDPVSDVHWWGSFIGWSQPTPPAGTDPLRFHLGIWTDVPAGVEGEFSHPGRMLWEYVCEEYTVEFVGWDWDPRDPTAPPEACFRFDCDLPEYHWFHQGPGENIYWLSIAADYEASGTAGYPFGWTTRPRDPNSAAPDDAVRIYDPTAPTVYPPSLWGAGAPIYWPTPEESWDTAFILTTKEETPSPGSKWSQLPHGSEGFDAISDLWYHWPGMVCVFGQDPDEDLPGLNAHDWETAGEYNWITLADAWSCQQGDVISFSWYGNYELDPYGEEIRGSGIEEFRLSLHEALPVIPHCLPGEELWATTVPFEEVNETATGTYNIEGAMIYRYQYTIPRPHPQVEDTVYYFDLETHAVEPMFPAYWRWQESNRSPNPNLCAAAERINGGTWHTIEWPGGPAPEYTDLAFEVAVGDLEVNQVVADDFISDGRPISTLRWWGSYFDDRYAPESSSTEPYVLDGWLITFHWAEVNEVPTCPPDLLHDPPPTALGIYFAPAAHVQALGLDMADCFGHGIYEYNVFLDECCLLCSHPDPRSGLYPAQEHWFDESRDFTYWISIQAVTGYDFCLQEYTGHLPSDIPGNFGHFWGWHTSPATTMPQGPLEEACVGRIMDFDPWPPDCFSYGEWEKQPWLCATDPLVNLAFELFPPECPIPAIELFADPPSGTVDARKPYIAGTIWPLYGIGMPDNPNTPNDEWSPITLNLGVAGAPRACFSLCETPVQDHPNEIAAIVEDGVGNYTITLEHGIAAGAITTIQYAGTGDFVQYYHHPSNVDGSGYANANDITEIVDCLLYPGSCADWQEDIDYSGAPTGNDIIETIDLLNGASTYEPWFGTALPNGVGCP